MDPFTTALEQLNPEQQKAVRTVNGKVLVLAGAGSGKTSVLTYRIAYLLRNEVSPESILGLTFTNKAANEMRERLCAIVGPRLGKKVFLTTFHSFCMHILRSEIENLGYTKNFSLYSEKEVRRLVNQLARHMLEHDGDMPSLEKTFFELQKAKASGLKTSGAKSTETKSEDAKWHDNFLDQLLDKLLISMRAYNAVDFDSLLTLTNRLFEEHPEKMLKYQEQYRYLLIDEYQDTNPVQYSLAEHLSKVHRNLFVVGDDDQSIYGWRGAQIENILNFPADTKIKLEQNYRSTPIILNAANAVIANNTARHEKTLWSNEGNSVPIGVFHAPTEIEEATGVAQRIISLKNRYNLKWSDFAILYRSNALSRAFEMALINASWKSGEDWLRGIPYEVFGDTELYERSEVKDIYAYLRIILNPQDTEALLRVINTPRRGISANCLDILTAYNREHERSLWDVLGLVKDNHPLAEKLSTKALSGIHSFVSQIEDAKKAFQSEAPLHESLKTFVETIDYKKTIKEDVKSEKMRGFKWENVEFCIQSLKHYEEENKEASSLHEFVSSSILDTEARKFFDKGAKEDRVCLMTFHSSKGLEFPACFLVGLEDHILPHEKSLKDTGIEEERRLFYVALTRAKRFLTLSMARNRKRLGKDEESNPSRFLFEIPQELMNVTSWQATD